MQGCWPSHLTFFLRPRELAGLGRSGTGALTLVAGTRDALALLDDAAGLGGVHGAGGRAGLVVKRNQWEQRFLVGQDKRSKPRERERRRECFNTSVKDSGRCQGLGSVAGSRFLVVGARVRLAVVALDERELWRSRKLRKFVRKLLILRTICVLKGMKSHATAGQAVRDFDWPRSDWVASQEIGQFLLCQWICAPASRDGTANETQERQLTQSCDMSCDTVM